jgi:AbrB family looped-hinge helix DNA binding protein
MRTTVTNGGRTIIPAALRKRYGIKEGDLLEWLDSGTAIKVIPIPPDPIQALRGSARGERLLERLRESRE